MSRLFESVEEIGEKNKIIPPLVRALIVGPFASAAIYMMIEKTGIYLWLRDVQIDLFDGYYMVLSILLTLIICVLPSIPLIVIARKHYEKKKKASEVKDSFSSSDHRPD